MLDQQMVSVSKGGIDTPTHLDFHGALFEICGVAYTHSTNAVAFAQAGLDIPSLGTTHTDYFYGSIPCTRELTKAEVEEAYEVNTGKVTFERVKDVVGIPAIVVRTMNRLHGEKLRLNLFTMRMSLRKMKRWI